MQPCILMSASSQPRARILIADDDELFRPVLEKNLARLGFEVVSAVDGEQAFALFEADAGISVVITDIRMPKMDGLELTRKIKERRPVPVVLITGFSEVLETRDAYELGADEFLAKPFDREELAQALERCLGIAPVREVGLSEERYCKLGIEDFLSGRQIQFNIFVRLSEDKYVKVAQRGEDLSIERVRLYKTKGVDHLYLRHEDFRKYVGFTLTLTRAVRSAPIAQAKKLHLIRHTGELLLEIAHDGLDQEVFDSSRAFVQTTVEVLCDEPDVFELLQVLNSHADHLYAHAVGVSLYGVMLADAVGWKLPTNKFKVAVGGLLHDIGEKEVPREVLEKKRGGCSVEEIKLIETHPIRGVEILARIPAIHDDVLHIIRQHHEDCLAQGYPARLRRSAIHPMAKLIRVADEFCERVIRTPAGPGMAPREALDQIEKVYASRLEPQFFDALKGLFA